MSPEAIQIALAVIGLFVTLLLGAFGFIAGRMSKIEEVQRVLADKFGEAQKHTAENYVRSSEIDRVERAIENVRSEVHSAITGLRAEVHSQVGKLTDAINALIREK